MERNRSLPEVHASVPVPVNGRWWHRWLAIAGPALLTAVGYMDPGNWATDIAAGSRYNYSLIWVLFMSSLMAILLQSMAARLGIVARRDLAQICHEEYPPIVNISLYLLAELAIVATDLAEVLGTAIAFQLLFGLPLIYGVILTVLDTFLLMLLSHYGIRKLEAVVLALVGTIGASFVIEILLGQPNWGGIARGFIPSLPDATALYIAIGILGATVMPHNLYLHSALVQTRKIGHEPKQIRDAIRWNNIDTGMALNLAFLINAAIMIMAASVFYRNGYYGVAEIQDAHRLLEPLLGTSIAPIAFAVALLASGQSSTVTGTLAGQIIMEGYLNLRIRPWLRRLITRLLAIGPAVLVIYRMGEDATSSMLVLSQVILSLQLPFAIIPLIQAVSDKRRMGTFVVPLWLQTAAWFTATIILALNFKLVLHEIARWTPSDSDLLLRYSLYSLATIFLGLLAYIIVHPWLKTRGGREYKPHRRFDIPTTQADQPFLDTSPAPYRRIAIALDFSGAERQLLEAGLRVATLSQKCILVLMHVVESPAARALGREAKDLEMEIDQQRLQNLAQTIRALGLQAEWRIGAGDPASELARLITQEKIDLVIMGAHGHTGISNLVFGETIDKLRRRITADILIVPLETRAPN